MSGARKLPSSIRGRNQWIRRYSSISKHSRSPKRWIWALPIAATLGIATYVTWPSPSVLAKEPPKNSPMRSSRSTITLEDMPTAYYDLSEQNLRAAQDALVRLLGTKRVITDLGERIARSSTDWSAAPDGDADRVSFIVLPQTTEEVSQIAKYVMPDGFL